MALGKTTLLNCISTIDNVSSGHIYLGKQDITEIKEQDIAKFRRENLGFIFQDFNLLDTLTIEENIALILTINKIVKRAYRKAELDENVYTVHTLRHTCATLLYRSGVNIKTIQELLGHVHIDTTEIYTHLDNQEVKDVMFEHPLAQFKMEDALAYCA